VAIPSLGINNKGRKTSKAKAPAGAAFLSELGISKMIVTACGFLNTV
jgi:hypothetical protein